MGAALLYYLLIIKLKLSYLEVRSHTRRDVLVEDSGRIRAPLERRSRRGIGVAAIVHHA